MSMEMHDPTGEYKRQRRKLRAARVQDLVSGIFNLLCGAGGIVLAIALVGYLLWTHSTNWLGYGLALFLIIFCAFQLWLGRSRIQDGTRTITVPEVTQAKEKYRQELHRMVKGQLPTTFSKASRYTYLAMILFFGLLSSIGWYTYAARGMQATPDVFGTLIGSTIALVIALMGFLISFAGKAYQQERVAELRHILQAGEFAPAPDDKG
ncbi:MAG: hypothetical protein ACRDHZ_00425 [Ktedonobacteraceae bacterium]